MAIVSRNKRRCAGIVEVLFIKSIKAERAIAKGDVTGLTIYRKFLIKDDIELAFLENSSRQPLLHASPRLRWHSRIALPPLSQPGAARMRCSCTCDEQQWIRQIPRCPDRKGSRGCGRLRGNLCGAARASLDLAGVAAAIAVRNAPRRRRASDRSLLVYDYPDITCVQSTWVSRWYGPRAVNSSVGAAVAVASRSASGKLRAASRRRDRRCSMSARKRNEARVGVAFQISYRR